MHVTTLTPGATFAGEYGTDASVTADADGVVTLTVPALGAVVLGADATVGRARDRRPSRSRSRAPARR